MQLFSILSRLLDYPDKDLIKNLDKVTEAVECCEQTSISEKKAILEFVSWMRTKTQTGLQQTYVETFDMVPEHDLHLTHHIFGDDKGRGPALIDLSEHFKNEGLEIKKGEIPDFLPLLLEFASTLDEIESRVFLGDAKKIIKILADNLEQAKSPYARLIRIVEKRSFLADAA